MEKISQSTSHLLPNVINEYIMEICTSESKVVAFKGNEKNVLNKRNT
jgi:hypothetical protein